MTIQPISTTSALLYLTPTDLLERGFCADEMTEESILKLAQDTLRQAGLSPSEPLQIEAYPNKCGLLIFIHTDSAPNRVWTFHDFEALLAAAFALSQETITASLYWWNDVYWLTLSGQDDKHDAILSEFGHLAASDPYIAAKLEEHGTLLLVRDAFKTLHHHFHAKKRELP